MVHLKEELFPFQEWLDPENCQSVFGETLPETGEMFIDGPGISVIFPLNHTYEHSRF